MRSKPTVSSIFRRSCASGGTEQTRVRLAFLSPLRKCTGGLPDRDLAVVGAPAVGKHPWRLKEGRLHEFEPALLRITECESNLPRCVPGKNRHRVDWFARAGRELRLSCETVQRYHTEISGGTHGPKRECLFIMGVKNHGDNPGDAWARWQHSDRGTTCVARTGAASKPPDAARLSIGIPMKQWEESW